MRQVADSGCNADLQEGAYGATMDGVTVRPGKIETKSILVYRVSLFRGKHSEKSELALDHRVRIRQSTFRDEHRSWRGMSRVTISTDQRKHPKMQLVSSP